MIEGKPELIPTMESEGAQFKKSGRKFVCSCFFHPDKHPSCFADPEKQIIHCFSCGFHDDIIGFEMKLHGLSFKDALVYLGIKPGKKPLPDPAIERKKKIQRDYEAAINNLYESLCQQARYFHGLRIKVKKNPGALTETGSVHFAERMAALAVVDYKLDTLLDGDFEDHILLLTEMKKNENNTERRAA